MFCRIESARLTALALVLACAGRDGRAQVVVDLPTMSYHNEFIDVPEDVFTRRYASSDVRPGLFGRGWCTYFDERLTRTVDGGLEWRTCRGNHGTFQPVSPGLYRSEDRTYLLRRVRGGFEVAPAVPSALTLGELTPRRFDAGGHIVRMVNEAGEDVVFTWRDGRLTDVVSPQMRAVLAYSASGRVVRFERSTGRPVLFRYGPDDTLEQMTNAWGNTYEYRYNDRHQLIRTNYPDGTTGTVSYAGDGAVTAIVERVTAKGSCSETYDSRVVPSVKFETRVTRTCRTEGVEAVAARMYFAQVLREDPATGVTYVHKRRDWSSNTGLVTDTTLSPSGDTVSWQATVAGDPDGLPFE